MTFQNPPFVPFPDWDAPQIDESKATLVDRVNLYEVPLKTLIHFRGVHPDSLYYCKIAEHDGEKAIKIWFKQRANCAIGSLKHIGSLNPDWSMEHGVMTIGRGYVLPQFDYENKEGKIHTILNYNQIRTEPYRQIVVQMPELVK